MNNSFANLDLKSRKLSKQNHVEFISTIRNKPKEMLYMTVLYFS